MKKHLSILLLSILFAPYSYGAAVLEGEIITDIPDAVKVEVIPNSKNTTTISADNGTHPGLRADFILDTNSDDTMFDFVLSGNITTENGLQNCYFLNNNNLYLLLGNIDNKPTQSAYDDIVYNHLSSNPNIIAYPASTFSDGQIETKEYEGKLCCVLKTGGLQRLGLSQDITGSPLNGTYTISEDNAGSYQVILTFNALRKP